MRKLEEKEAEEEEEKGGGGGGLTLPQRGSTFSIVQVFLFSKTSQAILGMPRKSIMSPFL